MAKRERKEGRHGDGLIPEQGKLSQAGYLGALNRGCQILVTHNSAFECLDRLTNELIVAVRVQKAQHMKVDICVMVFTPLLKA